MPSLGIVTREEWFRAGDPHRSEHNERLAVTTEIPSTCAVSSHGLRHASGRGFGEEAVQDGRSPSEPDSGIFRR